MSHDNFFFSYYNKSSKRGDKYVRFTGRNIYFSRNRLFISKLGLFNKQTRKQVTDLVLNIVLPVATAKSFLIKLTPSIMKTTLVVFLVSIGIQGLYFIINKTAYNNQEETKKINLQYATMVSNAGFMGMPFAQGLYGDMGLLYACIYLIPQRIFMWSYTIPLYKS